MYPYEYGVSFRLRHPTNDLEGLFKQLCEIEGLIPGRIWLVGDERQTIKGKRLDGHYKESYCYVSLSEGLTRSSDQSLPESIEIFLEKTEALRDEFTQHVKSGGELEFFIGLYVDGNNDITLNPSLMGKLSELNIELGFDIYPPDTE